MRRKKTKADHSQKRSALLLTISKKPQTAHKNENKNYVVACKLFFLFFFFGYPKSIVLLQLKRPYSPPQIEL